MSLALRDQVVYIGEEMALRGKAATVIALDRGPGKSVGLEFGEPVALGHSCEGHGAKGHCWWVRRDEVRLQR